MARNRNPKAKADVSGASTVNPSRYRDRSTSAQTRPVGDPYPKMTDAQKVCWAEFKAELPWLNSAHRPLLRLACVLAARMDEPTFGVQATMTLSAILSKLGATPVDESKVHRPPEEDEDPADRFFGRTH
jgi:hypothetical protein